MFAFTHNNFNVSNLERSLKFYKEALDLEELRRYEGSDFTQCWLGDHGASKHELVFQVVGDCISWTSNTHRSHERITFVVNPSVHAIDIRQ